MSIGIVIATRLKSRRLPDKALTKVNGVEVLAHTLKRLEKTGIPIVLAFPQSEQFRFLDFIHNNIGRISDSQYFIGNEYDPMVRVLNAAKKYNLDHVIRITHDKIFIDPDDIFHAIDQYMKHKVDYLYSSTFTAGCGFEIISRSALEKACAQFKYVEHVSYAIKSVTDNVLNLDMSHRYQKDVRLLIDFPEDLDLMETIFSCLGNDCTQKEVFEFLSANPWAKKINRLPDATIYTCAHNAEKWIEKAMGSVAEQHCFSRFEYLLIDDHSTDKTPYLMSKFAASYRNCKYIRNGENIGLASSSNVALKNAKSPYIIRLDADDYFTGQTSLSKLLTEIKVRQLDAVYPSNYFGSRKTVQQGNEKHHVGGAVFKTSALNHLKFTDGLRGYEGLDLYKRAEKQLKVGYLAEPIFFYRQHSESMSHTNPEERQKQLSEIESRLSGTSLNQMVDVNG